MATLALLNCGVPTDDPTIKSALAYLQKVPPKFNYVVCLQTMVFAQADPVKYALVINKNVAWLESQQKRDKTAEKFVGGWGYPDGYGDNSNSQFAVLALYEAQRRHPRQPANLAPGPAILVTRTAPRRIVGLSTE